MIAVLTAKVWGKAPSDYLFGDPLILAIDYHCAQLLSEHQEKERDKESTPDVATDKERFNRARARLERLKAFENTKESTDRVRTDTAGGFHD